MFVAISAPHTATWYPKTTHSPAGRLRPTSFRVSASFSSSLPDDPKGKKLEYTPWLIVGLGNPGTNYHGTRHNVGFEMIDKFAQREGITLNTIQSKALMGIGSIGEVPVLVAKPLAYMNYSGESVGPLAAYYKVPLRHILLIYDEMSLPNGVLRLQPTAGHGHHNGVKNVMQHLDGRKEFPRLCIGPFSAPITLLFFLESKELDLSLEANIPLNVCRHWEPTRENGYETFSFTKVQSYRTDTGLSNIFIEPSNSIDVALEQGIEAVRSLVLSGFNDSVTRFNLGQKYKYHKV
ncbi:LOW QUALITY PROTEIN: hypothetical protein Cgig2_022370 [Carnegiea gigantea]|uniref:Chloroplastic group IIB intron splicing facilitator CRS2, chloroplastic n=1 Tax=Carnegiea gigantea TaxID=171969 RepID=A0A9Q1KGT8_9CARY|nr:LOW QUALITY PROTEIN: hypothetical protein Cgig2_022370 [Carnegiea gigantea]